MNKRIDSSNGSVQGKRMLSAKEAREYCGIGRMSLEKFAAEIGATFRIGRRVLYDRTVIDKALDQKDPVDLKG